MTDHNHSSIEEPLLSGHEESLLRSALNRRSVTPPDVDSEWERLFPDVHPKTAFPFTRIVHVVLAVAAVAVLFWVIATPFLKERQKVAVSPTQEQRDSLAPRGQHAVARTSATAEESSTPTETIITPVTLTAPKSAIRQFTLPDGTSVWLNAGSELRYAFSATAGDRKVFLKGEGYFEVHHDAHRPFSVAAGELTITDIGTAFNIRAYEGAKPEVVVVEGRIKANLPTGASCVVGAGKKATLSDGHITIAAVDTYPFIQWRNGLFYFHNTPLLDAVKEIGRWYGCNIIIENSAKTAIRIHFVAERRLPLNAIVNQLNDIDGVNVSDDNGFITVR